MPCNWNGNESQHLEPSKMQVVLRMKHWAVTNETLTMIMNWLETPYRAAEMRWQVQSWGRDEWREGWLKRGPWPTWRSIRRDDAGEVVLQLFVVFATFVPLLSSDHPTVEMLLQRETLSWWHRPFVFARHMFAHVVFHTTESIIPFNCPSL